ncbi:4102_t:CDS:2, partial [Scutellospora calospora]
FFETYTLNAIKHAYAATGIWPLNPNTINSDHLIPFLPTYQPAVVNQELENENKELHEYIQRLEHPGTASLASIIKYPHPKQLSVEKKPQFGTLVTAESIAKELEDIENVKCKKIEDTKLRKE